MSTTGPGSPATSALVRVSVMSGSRRVDLVLPGVVPVAELVPELARSVGLLEAGTVSGGYRVVVHDGRVLAGEAGLAMQGVEDGALLTVSAGIGDIPPPVYDDVVEAMADAVGHELRPWDPATRRRTALGAAAALLCLGATALLMRGPSLLGGVAAGLVALLLTAGGVVLARSRTEPYAGIAVALLAPAHAGVAGLLLTSGGSPGQWPLPEAFFGLPVAAAGAAVLLVGTTTFVGLGHGRTLLVPVVVVGALLGAAGLLHLAVGYDPSVVYPAVMTVLVLAGSVFPWLALDATGTRVDQLCSHADLTADPAAIDPQRVRADARVAHEVHLALSTTVGVLLAVLAPFAVGRGVSGTVLAVLCCAAVMLRTRQQRSGSEVLVGLLSGIVGLASTTIAVLILHDGWRAGAAVALTGVGVLLLVTTLVPMAPSVRRDRAADLAESVVLLSLLPLTVVAVGVLARIAG